jgi:transmembrane sensor
MSAAEAAQFEAWVRADADRAALVNALRGAWGSAAAARDGWNAERALRQVRESTAARRPLGLVRGVPPVVDHRWRSLLAVAATVLVVLGGATIARMRTPAKVAMTEYRAARGQRVILRLSDGTQVTLAPGSVLRRPKDYGVRSRRLELEGEGYFVVTHDAVRPFSVQTAALVARDLGTRFAVRAYSGDSTTSVVVAEGQVSVDTLLLGVGDGVDARGSAMSRKRVSLDQALAWTTGQLVFSDTPLADVARRLSRWYDIDVRLATPDLATKRVTASFGDEPASAVLDAIARSLGLQLEHRESTYQLLHN